MEWVKSHLTVVIVGAISSLALAMLVLGSLLSEASAHLQKDVPLLASLKGLQSRPIGRPQINKARQHKENEAAKLREFLDQNKETGERHHV